MTFSKCNFAIRTKDGLQWRDGYAFEACFSNGWLHEMAVYKEKARDALHKDNWIVSDIDTGLAVCDGRELFDDGCSICNGYVGDGDNYCSNCGARVVVE